MESFFFIPPGPTPSVMSLFFIIFQRVKYNRNWFDQTHSNFNKEKNYFKSVEDLNYLWILDLVKISRRDNFLSEKGGRET